jgi:23S rRNA pseudouridine1911/1915/1917 synthase
MVEQARVRVNGSTCRISACLLQSGDVVEIGSRVLAPKETHGIVILGEDDHLLVVQKPPGLLTVATLHEKERTAYAYLREFIKRNNPRGKLYIVHRLDKFVSGVLVFAKSETVKARLQALFRTHQIRRKYWAVVEGRVARDHGTIESRLAEDRAKRMRSIQGGADGKIAITHFQVLQRFSNLTALEVTLETGRKNQIRAHLSEMGHPVVGDKAYGSTVDPLGRMGLHAFLLGFRHPILGTPVLYSTQPPPEFRRYLPPGTAKV